MNTFYNGTNSKAEVVGDFANKNELVDSSLNLNCIDKVLACEIKNGLIKSKRIEDLTMMLDHLFINRLKNKSDCIAAVNKIITRNGDITARELSAELYYSEKHIRRLFFQHVGISPKKFSRIVRANYSLRLLQENPINLLNIAEKVGYFDQSHFVHDFKDIFNLTPREYIKNMSAFYNAESI